MAKKYEVSWDDLKGLQNLVKELNNYANDLSNKDDLFVQRLAEIGYKVAEICATDLPGRYGSHKMGERVHFEIQPIGNGESLLVGIGDTFTSSWKDADGGYHTAVIYPMNMLEFGSAGFALPFSGDFGGVGGKGTFTIAGHDNDTEWGYNNGWTAITPTRPMYNASINMIAEIYRIAREVYLV